MDKVDFEVKKIIATKQDISASGESERFYLVDWSPAWVPAASFGSYIFNDIKNEFRALQATLQEPSMAAKYPTWLHVSSSRSFGSVT
jgi:hypothetical protein